MGSVTVLAAVARFIAERWRHLTGGIDMRFRRMVPFAAAIALTLVPLSSLEVKAQTANGSEISLLQTAYSLLSNADHDYDGHRIQAMKSIRAAATSLRVSLRGEGNGGQQQSSSDEQLRQAQKLLKQVRSAAVTRNQRKILKNVDAALAHLDAALRTK